LAELPRSGWDFEYIEIERPRRGRSIFRPAVPVRLSSDQPLPTAALVDSGSEHTLAARWLMEDFAINRTDIDRLTLGIGGRVVEALFAPVTIRLHREHSGDEFVEWTTDVGFIEPWDAEFFVILGQIGFFDQFTVAMSRTSLTVHIEPDDALHNRLRSL
jgi:hypothetical protein